MQRANSSIGLAVIAYLVWGFAALYWVQLEAVTPVDLVAHRTIWSLPLLLCTLLIMQRLRAALALLKNPRQLAILATSSVAQAANWGLFLWAVTNEQASQASLGYFLLPLINVAIGRFLLGETVERAQGVAIGLASIAMVILVVENGGLPWVALGVAVSFGIYGLIRKEANVDAIEGLFVEILLIAPIALVWLALRDWGGLGHFGASTDALLLGAGVLTVVPLGCYVVAARRMTMTAMGLVFYLGPSCQLFVAVCIFGEPMNPVQLFSFSLVWLGLALMVADTLRRLRSVRRFADE